MIVPLQDVNAVTQPLHEPAGQRFVVGRLQRLCSGLPERLPLMNDDAVTPRPRAVVAIPVRNEAERIEGCLRALSGQIGLEANGLGAVLFLNNCTDETARIVASYLPKLNIPARVAEREFAGANAGWARREAMEAAAAWLEESGGGPGVILTSDADSQVPPDWVARNLAAIAAGADAVAGRIALDVQDAARLPAALHARGRLEGTYEALLVELESLLDPLPHDPWPRHWTTSGATLAVRLGTYRSIGGMPPLALGEDRAFVSSLLSSDALVRHDPTVSVATSGRLQGRAEGGAADTMRLRCEVPDSLCDLRLEPLPRALFRYAWKRRLRRLHAERSLSRHMLWAPWLGLGPETARAVTALPGFGSILAGAEAASPWLVYRPLRPAELPANIRLARIALTYLRHREKLRGILRSLAPTAFRARAHDAAEQARI